MKCIQITDLHIGQEGEGNFGVDVRQNFLDLLKTIKVLDPELIVVTGDLCYDTGDVPIYQWIKSHLDAVKIPYTVISGNHDSPRLLAKVFQMEHLLKDRELYYCRQVGGQTVLYLETSVGIVSKRQLDWLANELSQLDRNAVIFMHHPPLLGGVPHMDDNYALQNMEEVQEVLFNFPHHLNIFCGHYHVEKTVCIRNISVHITPSAYFQIDRHTKDFQVGHFRIALREINFREDGGLENFIQYLQGNKLS